MRVRVDGTAARADRGHRAGQEQEAHDRGGRRPAGGQGQRWAARLADSLETALRLADGRGRRWRCRTAPGLRLLGAAGLRGLRHLLPGARAAHVLVQQPVRRLPGLRRPRHALRDRSRAGGAGSREDRWPGARSRRGRGRRRPRSSSRRSRVLAQAPRVRPRDAVGASSRRRRATSSCTASADDGFEGVVEAARAPLQGDGLRGHARRGRALHGRAALPGLRRRAAAAGDARGQIAGRVHRRRGARSRSRRRASSSTRSRSSEREHGDRPARPQGDPRAAGLPRPTSGSTT